MDLMAVSPDAHLERTPGQAQNSVRFLHRLRRLPREASILKTLYWNHRCNLDAFSLIVYPNTHLYLHPGARIIHNAGYLRLGCRWSVENFKPSELIISDGAIVEINGDCRCYTGCSIVLDPGAKLSLGAGCMLNMSVRMAVFNAVSIGSGAHVSEGVTFRDSDNHAVTGGAGVISAPINIGDHVLIGVNATILKGVSLGEGCIVAAGALVNKSFPPRTLIGGVPAKALRHNVAWKL